MDLNTVRAVVPTADPDDFRPGDAWLAGGTVLFSAGSPGLARLLDLGGAGWEPYTVRPDGIEFAATCTIAQLHQMPADPAVPAPWTALDLVAPACEAFVASFKIWNQSTMGGNIVASLPAGPVTSLCASLDGSLLVLGPGGGKRREPVAGFVRGDGLNSLRPGELVRSIFLPAHALRSRTALRRISLTTLGRTAAMVIGRVDEDGQFVLTVSGSTARPVQLRFAPGRHPGPAGLLHALETGIGAQDYHDDIHGRPAWRRAMTHRLALEVLGELFPAPRPGSESRGP